MKIQGPKIKPKLCMTFIMKIEHLLLKNRVYTTLFDRILATSKNIPNSNCQDNFYTIRHNRYKNGLVRNTSQITYSLNVSRWLQKQDANQYLKCKVLKQWAI